MSERLLEEVRAAQAALEAKREASRKRSVIDACADDVLELAFVHHVPAAHHRRSAAQARHGCEKCDGAIVAETACAERSRSCLVSASVKSKLRTAFEG